MKKYTLLFASLMLLWLSVNGQNERIMLLESFTNTGCSICAVYSPTLDALLAANPDKVVAISYHASWPSSADPMFLHNTSENTARTNYYGINSLPHVVIDGNRFSGSPNNLSQSIISQLLAIPSPIQLHLTWELNDTQDAITVHVTGYASTDLSGDLNLYVGVIEKEIVFNSSPDTNGETEFHNVMKKLLPNSSGLSLGSLVAGEHFSHNFTWELDDIYDMRQLEAIVWIQNQRTKEVYQACKSGSNAVPSHANAVEDDYISLYPNPTDGLLNIVCEDELRITIFDRLGQRVYEGDCNRTLQIDLKRFGAGVYAVKVGNKTQKIVVK